MDGRIMGCMGHPAVADATPNIDRLANDGVLFRNTFTNNPICCPSRASMWSGRYTHHCEGWNNYKGLEPGDDTFFDYLERMDYRIVRFGKEDWLSGSHSIRARVTPWTRTASIMRPSYNIAAPRLFEGRESRVHRKDWDDIDAAVSWLHKEGRDDEKPFLLYVGIRAPHPAFLTSRRYFDRINASSIDVPIKDEEVHPVMLYQRVQKNWTHGFSEEMARLVRHVYYAMIAEVDEMLGRLLEAVAQVGLTDNTYVLFSSDHGELAMEHEQFYKMSFYEGSVRVPLIIRGPGLKKGLEVDELVSLVDLLPTLLDMTGCDNPEGLDGNSLLPDASGTPKERPDWVLSEFHGSTINTSMYMLRTGPWKYISYPGYEPQLFRPVDDPAETRNYAQQNFDVVADLDRKLNEVVHAREVTRRVAEYDKAAFRRWRDERRREGSYETLMAQVYSGWDNLDPDEVLPWSKAAERAIETWLAS